MRLLLFAIVRSLVFFVLSLRYRVRTYGLDSIPKKMRRRKKGLIFMPNHPAQIDPVLMMAVLGPKYDPRPVVVDYFHDLPGVTPFMKLVRAIPVPDMEGLPSKAKKENLEKQFAYIIDAVNRGDNILIYPAGRLMRSEKESVKGASFAHTLIQSCPDARVVLVETKGLWGSRFSRALWGRTPSFGGVIGNGMRLLLKNALFFMPRRHIEMHFSHVPSDFPFESDRHTFNAYLDRWYNQHQDHLTLVSDLFYKEKFPESPKKGTYVKNWQSKREVTLVPSTPLPPNFESPWPSEKNRRVGPPWGGTILEAFIEVTKRMPHKTLGADRIVGTLKYKQFLQRAYVLATYFEQLPGKHIGVMLPSTTTAYLVILALYFANKIPVMFNWTVGSRSLKHALEIGKVEKIITARAFVEKLEHVDLTAIEPHFLFMEEVRKNLTLSSKLKGATWALMPKWIQLMRIKQNKKENAVILFTSGTESFPKGVPLTHDNILSDHRAALKATGIGKDDIFYSVLPPFHSFGFAVTGLLPILMGTRAFYAPDPTDVRAMANDIAKWRPTVLCLAPSFLSPLLRVAKEGQLDSIRLFVTGAEKTPETLFEEVKKYPHATLLQGYGVTETAPIAALNRLDEENRHEMLPLPDMEVRILSEDGRRLLQNNIPGEVCIAGPNVFSGYLESKDVFVHFEGKKWYRTGDRGIITDRGTLVLQGRLKRFVKIGGEMVSLIGLEEEVSALIQNAEEKPSHAVCVREKEGEKPKIVLYSTKPLEKEKVNAYLLEKGYSRLVKFSEVIQIEEIPMLGTGKINYRQLEACP